MLRGGPGALHRPGAAARPVHRCAAARGRPRVPRLLRLLLLSDGVAATRLRLGERTIDLGVAVGLNRMTLAPGKPIAQRDALFAEGERWSLWASVTAALPGVLVVGERVVGSRRLAHAAPACRALAAATAAGVVEVAVSDDGAVVSATCSPDLRAYGQWGLAALETAW